MESADHRESPAPLPSRPERASAVEYRRRRSRRHEHTPRLHRVCDSLTEALIYFTVVFGPWAFGTTQVWSTWVMNGAGYCLGALLVAKWVVRWQKGYRPGRWGDPVDQETDDSQPNRRTALLTRTLAVLTILILAYILVSALNARATYYHEKRWFDYHECIGWLPHSYDSRSTWFSFWQYLALAWFFWALRDWLLTQTAKERHHLRHGTEEERGEYASRLPARLRRLLWVVCLNGTALAVECILQRLSGTNKLLWLVEPRLNNTPESQFGPYAYRSNAAQYFNLVWPVCLAFWWWLHHHASRLRAARTRLGGDAKVLLLPCVTLIAACPIISSSRGGFAMAVAMAPIGLLTLSRRRSRVRWSSVIAALLVVMSVCSLGLYLGYPTLKKRFGLPNIYADLPRFASSDLTFLCSLSVPNNPPPEARIIAALSKRRDVLFGEDCLVVFLAPDGALHIRLYGKSDTNFIQQTVFDLFTNHAGTDIQLCVVKAAQLTIFTNASEVKAVESSSGKPPPWSARLNPSFLWVGHRDSEASSFNFPVLSFSLFNRALTPEEVGRVRAQGMSSFSEARRPLLDYELDSAKRWSIPRILRSLGLSGRDEIYTNAREIARQYSMFGTGPGTFAWVYQLYMKTEADDWAAFVHDDWLETRITFGWVGFGLVLTALLAVPGFWFVGSGIRGGGVFVALVAVALLGCLAHAKFDFPFQVYSVLHLFLLECAILTCLSRTPRR